MLDRYNRGRKLCNHAKVIAGLLDIILGIVMLYKLNAKIVLIDKCLFDGSRLKNYFP
jgi:hypothetical protein